ncbi:MAG TPA: flagellar type III secretion system protein FlhB [Roseomonas sp.]|jgi:flagellar biosynthetic protein FlhB
MAEDEKDAEDRTEAPTQRRLDRARDEGQVALSREAAMLATLAAGLLGLMMALPPMALEMATALRGIMAMSHSLAPAEVMAALVRLALLTIAPVAGLTLLGAVAGTLLQTRGLFSASGLAPNLSKLSPLAGLKRLLGVDAVIEFLRTLLKLGIVGTALWLALDDPSLLQTLLHQPASALLGHAADAGYGLMRAALLAFAVVAAGDLLLVRLRHTRKLRMSREDMRDEQKESEGDPHVKGRMKQLRLSKSRRRMLAAVPKAAVVITNPTHYAVALGYEQGSNAAPRILAKGVDAVAARIRAVAEENRVPIVPNPPLARALHLLELDAEIPQEHYQAVAEIIAFVWRLNQRAAGSPE